MIRRELPLLAVAAVALALTARADTLLLRDNSSITGRIIAEKSDQIVLDVGYTVLLVDFLYGVLLLVIAEGLGVLEELVDKRPERAFDPTQVVR